MINCSQPETELQLLVDRLDEAEDEKACLRRLLGKESEECTPCSRTAKPRGRVTSQFGRATRPKNTGEKPPPLPASAGDCIDDVERFLDWVDTITTLQGCLNHGKILLLSMQFDGFAANEFKALPRAKFHVVAVEA